MTDRLLEKKRLELAYVAAGGEASRDLGNGLAIVGAGDWIPAPGSVFMGVTYSWVDPKARIVLAPRFLVEQAFAAPNAAGPTGRVLEFPSGRMR
jgi:hypothetical protein